MKFIIAFTYFTLAMLMPTQNVPFSEIERAVVAADANSIVTNGADKILVSINNKESIYSKSQATMVLRDYFSKNKPMSFKISAKTQKSDNAAFMAGDCVSKNVKYRVTFQLKKVGDNYKIDRIVISEM